MKAVNSGATDNCDDLAVPLPNVEDDPLHLHLKIEVTDGLLDESGRAYIVALNGIIAHSGHKGCCYFVQLRIAKVKPLPCIKVRSTCPYPIPKP